MRQAFSSKSSAYVQTDRLEYEAGDTVRAVVCINVAETVNCTSIKCELIGCETTWWRFNDATRGGTHAFLTASLALSGARRLQPGQYQWHVVFAIPTGVPSSLHIDKHTEGVQVRYTLQVTAHTEGRFQRAIRSTRLIRVVNRVVGRQREAPATSCERSLDGKVSVCGVRRGRLHAHMHVDRAWCWPGDTVRVTVTVDNESGRTLKASQLFLQQQAVMYEQPGQKMVRRTVHNSNSIETGSARVPGPRGIAPFTSFAGEWHASTMVHPDMQPSYSGTIFTVSHFVCIRFSMGWFMMPLILKVPLRVLVGPLCATLPGPRSAKDGKDGAEVSFFAEPPAFWKPSVVVGPLALHVNAASPLPPEALVADASFWARATGGK